MIRSAIAALFALCCSCADEVFPTFTMTRTVSADGIAVTFVPTLPREYPRVSWAFGDGKSSTERSPTHTYNRNARYTVELRAEDEAGITVVPGDVVVEDVPLPPRATVNAFLGVPGYQTHAVTLLQLRPVGGASPAAVGRALVFAFRRGSDGVTPMGFGGDVSVNFRPGSADVNKPLALDAGVLTASLDQPHAFSPAWFLDGALFLPSSEPMPRTQGGTVLLSIAPLLANATQSLSQEFRIELNSPVDLFGTDEVLYVVRGQGETLTFTAAELKGTAPVIVPAATVAKLGAGVAEVYGLVRNVTNSVVNGVPLTSVNTVIARGAVLLAE